LVALSNKAPDAPAGTQSHIFHDDCSSTHLPSASVNVVSQRPAPSSPPHASSSTSQRKQSIEKKPQHVALDQDAIARRKRALLATSRTTAPVVAASPSQLQPLQSTSALYAEKRHSVFSSQPKPTVQHALTATEHKEAHPRPAINSTFQRYPSAQGHQVCFKETDGKWLAQVQDGWGRMQMLPVVFAPGQSPTQALYKLARKSTGQHKYLVHVLETSQTPWAPRVVYVGALGLRGGGGEVRSAPDSDDETNNINPFSFYRGGIKARADFYQAAGFWYAKVSYNNQYNGDSSIYNRYATAVPVKWPFTLFPLLFFGSLSANDLNASSNRICFEHLNNRITSIDCIEITSSIEDILSARRTRRDFRREMAQRERRREERRRQAEVRRQEEERSRQAEARRQEEEERRRQEEGQRLEAIKLAEEQAVQERARIEEATRIAALEAMKEQLEKSFENQALPELNLRLGELGIAYQNIPSQVLYDAIKTAMTQGAPIVPLPENPDDIQAAEESVNELLAGMQEAFNAPGVTLPPALESVFAGIDMEAFRPYARVLVAQVEAAQAAKAALIEANEIEVQESIARVQASTEALNQKNQAIAQKKAEEKEAEEAVDRERQAR
jgi:hypothetical protein